MLRVITQEYLGQPVSLGEAFQFALGRFLPLLGTSILAGLGIILGLFLCCIPGIYLAIVWSMISQVIVMENLAGTEAIGRSKALVEGYFWRVFGILFLVGIIIWMVAAACQFGIAMVLPFAVAAPVVPGRNQFMPPAQQMNNFTNYAIAQLTLTLVNTLGDTFRAICTTLLYFDLRNRKEAFNVEHLFAWSDQYRTWRDEPEPDLPAPGRSAGPKDTGIKPADGPSAAPPETGIKDAPPPGTP